MPWSCQTWKKRVGTATLQGPVQAAVTLLGVMHVLMLLSNSQLEGLRHKGVTFGPETQRATVTYQLALDIA